MYQGKFGAIWTRILNTHFKFFWSCANISRILKKKRKRVHNYSSYYMTSQTLYRLWGRESYVTLISMASLIQSCVLLLILCFSPKNCMIDYVSRCITLHSKLSWNVYNWNYVNFVNFTMAYIQHYWRFEVSRQIWLFRMIWKQLVAWI